MARVVLSRAGMTRTSVPKLHSIKWKRPQGVAPEPNGAVVPLGGWTRMDVPVLNVLEGAARADLDGLFLIGYDKTGDIYMASSYADGGNLLWLLAQAERRLLAVAERITKGDGA